MSDKQIAQNIAKEWCDEEADLQVRGVDPDRRRLLAKRIEDAVAAERERCAQILDDRIAEVENVKAALVRFGRMDVGQNLPNTDYVVNEIRGLAEKIRAVKEPRER